MSVNAENRGVDVSSIPFLFLDMRKLFFVFALAAVLFGCSSDDSEPSCRLMSVSTLPFWFDDYLTGVPSVDPRFDGKLHFSYVNGKIAKVKGGMIRRNEPHAFFLSGSVEDSIAYQADSVYVYLSHNLVNTPALVNTYKISNGQLKYVHKVERLVSGETFYSDLTYEYDGDVVIEKRSGTPRRTFEFENGNLVRVTQNFYGLQGQYTGKREWLFTNYDTSPNLLKGKFYVEGAFFAAFSENNYRRREVRSSYVVDGQEIFTEPSYVEYGLTYDADGVATLFEQSCN